MKRDLGIDAVRGVAVVSMFVAHFAPVEGPLHVFTLSEFLTAPLFATLIGASSVIGRPSLWSAWVRGLALIGLGLWLESVPSQISVVLVWLGILTWLTWLLVRLPSAVLLVLAGGLLLVAPMLQTAYAADAGSRLVSIIFTHPDYRLTAFVPFACLGIVLARWKAHWARVWVWLLVPAVALYLLNVAAAFSLDPYTGTLQEILFEFCLAGAVLCLVGSMARALPGILTAPVAALGAMALTAYVGQVVIAGRYAAASPTGTDDSWALLFAMVLGWMGLAWGWSRLFAGAHGGFRRGPLEGLVALVAAPAQILRNRT